MVVAFNTNVVKRGMVIRSAINVNHGSSEFVMTKNLNRSSKLPTVNTRIVRTPQMVFTNLIRLFMYTKP